MKVLNLYAGIGGNRKLWEDVEVTAVESEQYIADAYSTLFPDDEVVVGDAHHYLLDHHQEYDFIWSSPPCPTHSRMNTARAGNGMAYRYPDMTLYQEILFLKHFYKGKWLVENVEPYYAVLIQPRTILDRHFFWSNFSISKTRSGRAFVGNLTHATTDILSNSHGIVLPPGTKDGRKLLRNAVDPQLGLHIFNAAKHQIKQEILL